MSLFQSTELKSSGKFYLFCPYDIQHHDNSLKAGFQACRTPPIWMQSSVSDLQWGLPKASPRRGFFNYTPASGQYSNSSHSWNAQVIEVMSTLLSLVHGHGWGGRAGRSLLKITCLGSHMLSQLIARVLFIVFIPPREYFQDPSRIFLVMV